MSTDTVTRVSLQSSPDYLPRVRRIAACLADGVGMDRQEADDTTLVLTEACVNAIRHGSPRGVEDRVSITFVSSKRAIVADVTDNGGRTGLPRTSGRKGGFGIRLMSLLADSVEFIKHATGLTVRLTKRAGRSRAAHRAADGKCERGHRN